MTAHLTLPYNWSDCADPQTCPETIHLQDTAETLSNLPLTWLEALIGNCTLAKRQIVFYNNSGQRHNENGPAVLYHDGEKRWYLNGELHHEDRPAIIKADGSKEWYLNGKLHREDGPAIEYRGGGGAWYLNGKLHRENGPAIEYPNGSKEWWTNGECYRKEWWEKGKLRQKTQPTKDHPNNSKASRVSLLHNILNTLTCNTMRKKLSKTWTV